MEKNNFAQGISDYGKTEPTAGYDPFGGADGPTEKGGMDDWNFDKTLDAPSGFQDDTGFTPENYEVTTPVTPNNERNFLPVVGWLVCIEGPDRGRDYRVRDGYNTIGRDASNDICISGDLRITRERHALIGFDAQEILFFVSPDKGKNLIRLNNRALMTASELHPGDVLTIGSSKLMFVPLCSETFSWEKKD